MNTEIKDMLIQFLYEQWCDGVITWDEYVDSINTIAGIQTNTYERF